MITDLPLGFAGLKIVSVGILTLAIRVTLSLKVEFSLPGTNFEFGTPSLYKGITCGIFCVKAEVVNGFDLNL
jgi:hypothetical protein